ncbi:MAG TPA: hypothetical protein VNQ97_16075 [Burkholderiaceae bacterium]|nr:hypothetical protein [Burkholderiaceae bacterium]
MNQPKFFDSIPTIVLRDPLSDFLGSAQGGLIEYSYGEIVKLTGHSCPTVAGAWIMTTRALKRLYGDETPERGAISVCLRDNADEGVAGVMASVATYLTGATTDTGFKGIRGQFDRRNLLSFGQDIDGVMSFERLDTHARVTVSFNSAVVPPASNMMTMLSAATDPEATPDQKAAFAQVWQDRVRRIFESTDHPDLIRYS